MSRPHREDRCGSCGAELKRVTVREPIYGDHHAQGDLFAEKKIIGYRDVEEYADCIRCHGAY